MMAKLYERAIVAAIVVNVVVLVAGMLTEGCEEAFEAVHNAILAFFTVELAIHLRSHGLRWLCKPLNLFDACVILMSALPALGVDAGLLRLARLARLAHLARHLSGLRLMRLVPARIAPVLIAVAFALAPTARADDDTDTHRQICGAFDLGVPPGEIEQRLGEHDGRWNLWR